MTDDERARLRDEARSEANIENRISNLEAAMKRIWGSIGVAGLMVLASIWDTLKGVIFK